MPRKLTPNQLASWAEKLQRNLQPAMVAGVRDSLEAIRQKGRGTLWDVVADPSVPAPGSVGAVLRERADLVGLLDDLPERERTVIRLRFGLSGEEALTLEAVGKRLGLSRERVRQIEAAGLKKLRSLLVARGVDPADLFS